MYISKIKDILFQISIVLRTGFYGFWNQTDMTPSLLLLDWWGYCENTLRAPSPNTGPLIDQWPQLLYSEMSLYLYHDWLFYSSITKHDRDRYHAGLFLEDLGYSSDSQLQAQKSLHHFPRPSYLHASVGHCTQLFSPSYTWGQICIVMW